MKGRAGAAEVAKNVLACVLPQAFTPLDISIEHGRLAGALPFQRRDPFDRMLIAQARLESLAVVSQDPVFESYEIRTTR